MTEITNGIDSAQIPEGPHSWQRTKGLKLLGVEIQCGSQNCGSCSVRVMRGREFIENSGPSEKARATLERTGQDDDLDLACEWVTKGTGPIVVEPWGLARGE